MDVIIHEVVVLAKLLKVGLVGHLDALGYSPATACLRLRAGHGVVEFVSIDSFIGRYIILASPTLGVDGSSNTPQQFSPIGALPSLPSLCKNSPKNPLDELIHIFN
jgi:hypothetical protein